MATKRRQRGDGSIRRRGTRWQIAYDVQVAGQNRQQRYETFATEAEARSRLRTVMNQREDNSLPTVGSLSVADVVRLYLDARRDALRPQTANWYDQRFRNAILPEIGGLKFKGVTSAQLRQVVRTGKERGQAVATQQSTHRCLRTLFKWAMREGLIGRNPMLAVDPPSGTRHEVQAPDADTVRRLLAETSHLDYGVAYRLLAFTGARRSEIAALKWDTVDIDAATITIAGTLVPLPGELRFMPPKTRSSNRTVSVDAETVQQLRQHRARQAERLLASGGALRNDEGWLFLAAEGGPLAPQRLTDNWRAAGKRIGAEWPLHSLRHAHISQLLANGVPVKVVQQRAGHSNIGTTLGIYAHVLPGQDEAAATVFAQVMEGPGA